MRISRDWLVLFAYFGTIFFVLPFTEYAARAAIHKIPTFSVLVTYIVNLYVGLVGAALALYVAAVDKKFKLLRLLALVLILAASFYGLQKIKAPYDMLHIIEYSVLAFLLFRVLRFYNPTTALYLWCMIFTAIAGCVDEYVQQLIPGRCSSLKDLRTDAVTGILAGLSVMLVICPELERWRFKMNFLKKELHERTRWVDAYRSKRRALKDRHG